MAQNNNHRRQRRTQPSTSETGRYAHVTGWGIEVPERVMTNHEIELLVDTNDQWIQERTGIAERRIADDKDTTVTLGLRAARKALQYANVLPPDLDLVVVATSSPTHLFPATACMIQDRLGAANAGAFDVMAACSGFIYAMSVVASQIKAGLVDKALVIGTETLSRIVDWNDRGTCILFGDGAGAFVMEVKYTPGGVHEVVMHSDGSGGDLLYVASGVRPHWNGMEADAVLTRMNGREVFRFATRIMASATEEVLERAGMKLEEVDMIIPHQANLRIIQAAARGLKLPMDKFFVNIQKYGNTSTASIPIAVAEAVQEGKVKPDDRLVLVGFGGGLTWGALVMDWDVQETAATQIRSAVHESWYIVARVRSVILRLFRWMVSAVFGSPITPQIRAEERRAKRLTRGQDENDD